MIHLFLDISSTCTGYVIADVADKATILEAGAIWFDKGDSVAKKCYSLYDWILTINETLGEGIYIDNISKIVYESYVFNTSRVTGSLVCPHLQGAVMTAAEARTMETDQITPQTWRKHCGIKPVKTAKKKRDYKKPTEDYFRAKWQLPEKIESNVTGNMRATPSDYFDALGVCEGYCRGLGLEVEFDSK